MFYSTGFTQGFLPAKKSSPGSPPLALSITLLVKYLP